MIMLRKEKHNKKKQMVAAYTLHHKTMHTWHKQEYQIKINVLQKVSLNSRPWLFE